MNALEKISEEIEERVNMVKNIPVDEDDDFLDGEECYEAGRVQGRYEELLWCRNMIRSHMDDIPNCGDCSRRKWYQKGYEDGKNSVCDIGWIDCKKSMPGKDMDKQPVWIVYGSHGNLCVEFAYCKWVLSQDEDENDDSYTEFRIDQAPEPYHPSLNLVHYWKPVNIPEFKEINND